jgi:hypothetical protein
MPILFADDDGCVRSRLNEDWAEPEGSRPPWVPQSRAELDAELAATRERARARLAARNRECPACCEPISEPRVMHLGCEYDSLDL